MKLNDIEVGKDYLLRRGYREDRITILGIGDYKTKRVTGRVYHDHRGGSYGPPTTEVTTLGVKVRMLYDDGQPNPTPNGRPNELWVQPRAIVCTWGDHLTRKEQERLARVQHEEKMARLQDETDEVALTLRNAISPENPRGIDFDSIETRTYGGLCLNLSLEQARRLAARLSR